MEGYTGDMETPKGFRVWVKPLTNTVNYELTIDRSVSLVTALSAFGDKVDGEEYLDRLPVATGDTVTFTLHHLGRVVPSEDLDLELAEDGFEIFLDPLAVTALCIALPDLPKVRPIVLLRDYRPESTSWALCFYRNGRVGVLPRGNINIHLGWWVPVVPLQNGPTEAA